MFGRSARVWGSTDEVLIGSTSPRGRFPSKLDDSTGSLDSLFLRDGVGISDPIAQALARRVVLAEERVRVVDRLGRERGDLGVGGQARFPDLRAGGGASSVSCSSPLGISPRRLALWERRCSSGSASMLSSCGGAPSILSAGKARRPWSAHSYSLSELLALARP